MCLLVNQFSRNANAVRRLFVLGCLLSPEGEACTSVHNKGTSQVLTILTSPTQQSNSCICIVKIAVYIRNKPFSRSPTCMRVPLSASVLLHCSYTKNSGRVNHRRARGPGADLLDASASWVSSANDSQTGRHTRTLKLLNQLFICAKTLDNLEHVAPGQRRRRFCVGSKQAHARAHTHIQHTQCHARQHAQCHWHAHTNTSTRHAHAHQHIKL